LTLAACPLDLETPTPPRKPVPQGQTAPASPQTQPPTAAQAASPTCQDLVSPTTYCGTMACPGGGAYSGVLVAVSGQAQSLSTCVEDVVQFGLDAQCNYIPYDQALQLEIPIDQTPGQTPGTPTRGTPGGTGTPGSGTGPVAGTPGSPGTSPGTTPGSGGTAPQDIRGQLDQMRADYDAAQTQIRDGCDKAVKSISASDATSMQGVLTTCMQATGALLDAYTAAIADWADAMFAWVESQATPDTAGSTTPGSSTASVTGSGMSHIRKEVTIPTVFGPQTEVTEWTMTTPEQVDAAGPASQSPARVQMPAPTATATPTGSASPSTAGTPTTVSTTPGATSQTATATQTPTATATPGTSTPAATTRTTSAPTATQTTSEVPQSGPGETHVAKDETKTSSQETTVPAQTDTASPATTTDKEATQ
jgi:hypothetical protein